MLIKHQVLQHYRILSTLFLNVTSITYNEKMLRYFFTVMCVYHINKRIDSKYLKVYEFYQNTTIMNPDFHLRFS